MKNLKSILLASFLTVGAFTGTLFTACNPDPCKDIVCKNGGNCTDGSCNCPSGYEGTLCETLSRAKFLVGGTSPSTWYTATAMDNCLSGTQTYNQTFSAASADNQITVSNALGYNGMTVTLAISGNSFTQVGTSTSGAVTVSNYTGTIDTTVNPDKISFTYTASGAGQTINCTGSALKQ